MFLEFEQEGSQKRFPVQLNDIYAVSIDPVLDSNSFVKQTNAF